MTRYTMSFTKTGYVRYTSHLDMVRLFKRAFKRSKLDLVFSQGFNPHPKMVFAQPLSLGYFSVAEVLEFETIKDFEPEEVKIKLGKELPVGMEILNVSKNMGKMDFASKVSYATYIIKLNNDEYTQDLIVDFLSQKVISVSKMRKKKVGRRGKKIKELVTVDIKHMIRNLKVLTTEETLNYFCDLAENKLLVLEEILKLQGGGNFLIAKLDAGSNSNLNPELLMQAFGNYSGKEISPEDVEFTRVEIM